MLKHVQTERRRILLKFADLLVENAERLSYLDTVVTGKPISMGHFEVNDMAESFRCKPPETYAAREAHTAAPESLTFSSRLRWFHRQTPW